MSNKLKNKQKRNESPWTVAKEFIAYLLDMMICIYMLLVIAVMPFYYEEGFAHIGTDKSTFFRYISIMGARFILPALMIYFLVSGIEKLKKGNAGKQDRIGIRGYVKAKLSVTDCFALLYSVALLLSYLCSDYKENALWGANGWFMGLLPQLFLVAIYFLVSRFWETRRWMVLLFLPISVAVFVLGYLNRFGIFPIDMKVENVQFISTIGNINWYCGYLVSVFFGAYYLLWRSDAWNTKKKRWPIVVLMLYVAVGFATLVTQGSMSGLFALAVMLMVTFCLSVNDCAKMLLFWQEVLLFFLACLLTLGLRRVFGWQITYTDGIVELLTNSKLPMVMMAVAAVMVGVLLDCRKREKYPAKFFRVLAKIGVIGVAVVFCAVVVMIIINTLHPGSLGPLSEYELFTFSPTWGSNRSTTWKTGLFCFGEQNLLHKLVGVGPDSMSAYLYADGSESLKQMVGLFGNSALTNAHNEWITVLVNMGILGFVGFVGMMVSAILRFVKYSVNSERVILGACGFGLLAYTVNNMFSFQQSMSAATIFVILGIGEAYARSMRLLQFTGGQSREE